ncbi:DUF2382 domain-containing protein [Ilyomonas limi]|uniref:DUF2382 domain-containing protein n=1 Tax=Ilyomonas limi TaxID=2575867 RepID=A0A4U3L1G2_9BACT|nr:YsnF/AvaK domain-containing protein [Ilyomonas limi]TKK68815.1 DUF2382 domain-containing protein [Ilyomonas limi]
MNQTVIGLFNKSADAQQAMQRLLSNGFTTDNVDISVSTMSSSTSVNRDYDDDEHESGVARFFRNLFGDDDDDADKYSRAARNGKTIVTVHAQSSDQAEKAADILDDCGAVDVDENADDYNYNRTGAAPVGAFNETTGTTIMPDTTDRLTQDYDITDTDDTDITDKKIPIIEENLEVGKRTVQTGGVRLKSRIVEKPVEEDLRLRTERVYVERNPVDRPASDTDFDNFKEGETEVTERSEVPVVNKEARVVEEVSLGKDVDERTETVRDTVRKTEVDVENIDTKSNRDTTWRDNS